MARYNDAIGYLLEIRQQVASPWFSCLCDLAIASTGSRPGIEVSNLSRQSMKIFGSHADDYTPRFRAEWIPEWIPIQKTAFWAFTPCSKCLVLRHLALAQ